MVLKTVVEVDTSGVKDVVIEVGGIVGSEGVGWDAAGKECQQ